MRFFKIKHLPTGLYYQPTKGRFSWEKNNLSKKGKVYHSKPSLGHLSHGYNTPNKTDTKYSHGSFHHKFVESEWEIIEFVMVPLELYKNWQDRQETISNLVNQARKL